MCGCDSILGVIINQRTNTTMSDAFAPEDKPSFPAFLNNSIYLGGPVGPYWITVHNHAVRGSHELLPGVHVGGCLIDAHRRVKSGEARAGDTMFFHGYVGWKVAALQAEADAGKWTVVDAPAAPLLERAKHRSWAAYTDGLRREIGKA